jgi:predicted helicase
MRWHLLKTYDKIYTIDLHGNSKKKETAPDGSADVNVFDIMQGVSINIFIKTGKKKSNELGKVFHYDLFGRRDFKYDLLAENSISTLTFKELPNIAPNYFFVNKNFEEQKGYEEGFSLSQLFKINNVGIATAKDAILISESKEKLINQVENFYSIEANLNFVKQISYRLFDCRYIYYDTKIVERAREKIMLNFINCLNIGLTLCKQFKTGENYVHFFITDKIIESSYVSNRTSEITSLLPLYLYPNANGQQTIDQTNSRTPNLNIEIVNQIAEKVGLTFINEKETTKDTFAPIDILDYIYAVLHSPTYREKYKEFLKIDFPRVPYPKDKDTFWKLVKLGGEIRQIHLLESPVVDKPICKFNISGTDIVVKPKYENGNVYINETQYFEDVPEVAWNFYIGGYQPAQKWLKDRKDRELQEDDIRHYMKIIVALTETDRLMKEIDKIEIE